MDPPTTESIPPTFDELRRRDDYQDLQGHAEDPSDPVTLDETRRVENYLVAQNIFPRFGDEVTDGPLHVDSVPAPHLRPHHHSHGERDQRSLRNCASLPSDDNENIANEFVTDRQDNTPATANHADVCLLPSYRRPALTMDAPTTASIPSPFDELRRRDDNDQNLWGQPQDTSDPLTSEETPRVENSPVSTQTILPRFKDQMNDGPLHVESIPAHSHTHPNIEQHQQSPSSNSSALWDDNIGTAANEIQADERDIILVAAPYADVRVLTNSMLLTNPEALAMVVTENTNHDTSADFVPAAFSIDKSVLATGLTEDQFPAQATRRPAFVTVTVIKPYMYSGLGIVLDTDGVSGSVYISAFKGNTDLSRVIALSPLGVGDKILTVNGMNCAGLTQSEVMNLYRKVSGAITIAIENVSGDPSLVETMVEKDNPHSKVGLGFSYTTVDGGFLKVSSVSGMFANSFVEVGDRVVFVNGKKPRNAAEATDLIARSPRFVSLTVESRTGVVIPVNDEGITGMLAVKDPTPMTATTCNCCIL